ncbi:hypothetical protein, partial [Aminobacter aminovorans]|uniref:hypothetical protein n=1 Tax=Aminobacter aminovorans TaxID=83263 RepID=UPI001AEE8EF6
PVPDRSRRPEHEKDRNQPLAKAKTKPRMRPKRARNGTGICSPKSIQKLNQPTKQNPAEIRQGLSAV